MTSPLNLYATKVFAEHPISMWALDEQIGYISLLSKENLDIGTWVIEGATSVDTSLLPERPATAPFEDEPSYGILESAENDGSILIKSSTSIGSSSINESLGSFSIAFYCFTYPRSVSAIVGFEYLDSSMEESIVQRPASIPANQSWAFIAETFAIPEGASEIVPFVEFTYETSELDYGISINGFSIGQWSEEFHTESLGVLPQSLPSEIPLSGKGVVAQAYGLQGKDGYYISSDTTLYAKNLGLPLVFGSANSTVIYPNENGSPSLIIPGEGFMNKSGQYKPLTIEFWTNIQNNSVVSKRIFGPLLSSDGIYVDKHLIKLKVGKSSGSHVIKEWGRPMLVGIRLSYNAASLMINGEEVISLDISPESVNYPAQYLDGTDQDWLGFYAYEDVPQIQLEAVAIYPYEVAAIVQKKRFVYGQGVDFPISSSGLDNSTTVAVDYSLSNYAKNVTYPETAAWSAGYFDNLEVDQTKISIPSYAPPELFVQDLDNNSWIEDNLSEYDYNSPSIIMKPSSSWNDVGTYLYLKNTSFLNEPLKSFYGVFETPTDNTSKQVLVKFQNPSDGSFISIDLENEKVVYSIGYTNTENVFTEEVFYESAVSSVGDTFAAGLDIPTASSSFGSRVSAILGTLQSCSVYLGGQKDFNNTFTGKIFKMVFCSSRNSQKTENIFATDGVAADYHEESSSSLAEESNKESHIGTYTIVPKIELDEFIIDVAADCYWQDYVPLSYFGKFVKDYNGDSFFALDFIQFNIDYVKLYRISEGSYDTTGMPLKTYVSFQYLASGANAGPESFATTQPLSKTGIVTPGEDWLTTRYEVLNDSVIKLPPGQDFNSLALTFSIEITSQGVNSENLSVDSMSFASQALGQTPNKISTRFGTDIVPFKKSGLYFEYRNVQPFSIYKKDSPYLYLTKNSGIRLRGQYESTGRNGLSIPINKNSSDFFKVNLFQMFLRYEEESFPIAPVQIFELQTSDTLIKFFLVADSNTQQRGQIYAIDDTNGNIMPGIVYYIDGKVVKRPILNLNTWAVLGISFSDPQDFSSFVGALRFTSPILFNNVSYYQTTQLDEIQRFAYRKWSAVRSGIDNPLDWGYWSGKDQTPEGEIIEVSDGSVWREVLFLAEAEGTVPDAAKVYNQYVGTNSSVFDTGSSLRLSDYQSSVLKDIAWSTSVSTPV